MDCITFQKMIPDSMKDRLSMEELNAFMKHLDTCTTCHDELEINYIVEKAVGILDEKDASYDLKRSFENFLTSNRMLLQESKSKKIISYVVDTLAFWAVLSAALILYFRF